MKCLIDAERIHESVAGLGRRIAADYRESSLTVLGVLTGSVVLLADLIRQIDVPLRIGLIQASSYRGETTMPGDLTINTELLPDIRGRDVLLVDDIYDTGRTLEKLIELVGLHEPHSVRSATLLWKEKPKAVAVEPDYHCFRIPDLFVVGYGLDYDDEYRHLPYIAAFDEPAADAVPNE